jgi:pSer/pThr/pTyr-binding forkhead associated (FHA) protein
VALIVLTHGSISREHAAITVSASGSVVVVDLGSAQGTKISGKPLVPNKPHLLPPGSSLTFERSTRTFKLREGGSGFVSGEAGAAAVARAPKVRPRSTICACSRCSRCCAQGPPIASALDPMASCA